MKKERYYNVILCCDLYLDRLNKFYKLLVETIFEHPIINAVKVIPKSVLSIFTSGYSSGIIIDVGYLATYIIPVNRGFAYPDITEILPLSIADQERRLKNYIIEDNSRYIAKNFNLFTAGLNKHIDDIYTRSVICVNHHLSNTIKEQKASEYYKVESYTDMQDFQVFRFNLDILNE
jgi:actin-related protein